MKKGFTLLELVLVLGILTLLLGVVVLSFTGLQDRELDRMLEDLHYARTYAVSNQKIVRFSFDCDTNSYLIAEQESGRELKSRTLQSVKLIKPFHLTNPLLIYPTGAFSRCGHLVVENRGKFMKLNFTVGVARFTLGEMP